MKIMKKDILIIVSFLWLLSNLSCNDTRLNDLTEPKIYFSQSGVIVKTIYKTGEPFAFNLGVHKAGYDDEEARATLKVMNEEELNRYNSENSTDFKVIPENCYQLSTTSLTFDKGERLKYVHVSIDYNAIDELPDFDHQNSLGYVVPLMISEANLGVNEEKRHSFIKILMEEALIYFTNSHSSLTIGSEDTYHQSLTIEANLENKWDISINLAVDESLVEQYNAEYGEEFAILPSDAYSITPNPVVLENGKQSVEIIVSLEKEKINFGDFLLPVTIQNTSRFSIDQSRDVAYVHVSYPVNRLDRSDWSIADFSDQEAVGEGANNGHAHHVLDDDPATFWHSEWLASTAPMPHHITIDMKKEVTVVYVELQRRINRRDTRGGNFFISSDNINYTKIGTFEMDTVDEAQMFSVTPSRGRYLKVEITESLNPPICALGEIYVRGVE